MNEVMNNERVDVLFTYLDKLSALTASDYRCNTEIDECIKALRKELKLSKPSVITPDQLRWMIAEIPVTPDQALKLSGDELDFVVASLSERLTKEIGGFA